MPRQPVYPDKVVSASAGCGRKTMTLGPECSLAAFSNMESGMTQCKIRTILGALPEGHHGQWLEATVSIIEPECFEIRVDLCERCEITCLAMHRVDLDVPQPFTAELVLAVLAYIAKRAFSPTRNGLAIWASGDIELAKGELARLLEPEVRIVGEEMHLPPHLRHKLDAELRRALTHRGLHLRLLEADS